jgi:AbrB family looped-hinge helix DNA binding protein
MTAASTLSSKYRVSIPKAVRERVAWRPGQKIAFIARADGILMVPIPEREALAGMARCANPEGRR